MTTTKTELQSLAGKVSAMFTKSTRADGHTEYWHLKNTENAPEWVRDLCHDAHGEMLPDDWKYQFIVEALDALSENEDPGEICMEPDIYTGELTAWVSSHLERVGYVDECIDEFGVIDKDTPLVSFLSYGQQREKEEVLQSVRASLEAHLQEEK